MLEKVNIKFEIVGDLLRKDDVFLQLLESHIATNFEGKDINVAKEVIGNWLRRFGINKCHFNINNMIFTFKDGKVIEHK